MRMTRADRAVLRMRSVERFVITARTKDLNITPEEAAELIRGTESCFIQSVSVGRTGIIRVRYTEATPERMRLIIGRVLYTHIVRPEANT